LDLNLITDTPDEWLLTVKELAQRWSTTPKKIISLIDSGQLAYCDLTPDGVERRTGLRIPISVANKFIEDRTIAARTSAA
jgi:hypothetical protein